MAKRKSGIKESVVLFGDSGRLTGIFSHPKLPGSASASPSFGIVLMNAGLLHRIGPHRLNVRLARHFAGLGYPVIRFDHSGLGDSPAGLDGGAVAERRVSEVRLAMDALAEQFGLGQFVLLGICSGARVALGAALDDQRVVGMAGMEGFELRTGRYRWARLLSGEKWGRLLRGDVHTLRKLRGALKRQVGTGAASVKVSGGPEPASVASSKDQDGGRDREVLPASMAGRPVRALLNTLLNRQCQVLLAYRAGNETRFNFRLQREGDRILALGQPKGMQVAFIPEADHTFTLLSSQARLIQVLTDWMAHLSSLPFST